MKEMCRVDSLANISHLLYGIRSSSTRIEHVLFQQNDQLRNIPNDISCLQECLAEKSFADKEEFSFSPANTDEELQKIIDDISV